MNLNNINSEEDLEKELDEFLKEDKYKICFIKYIPKERLLNYISFFIEYKEKEYLNNNKEDKKQKKAFIIIIYLFRIFNLELKNSENNNNNLSERISFVSDYYQIFIDNLNGNENDNIYIMIN